MSNNLIDAIGRAHAAGLLIAPNASADAMRDAGRLLFKLYWAHYAELVPTRAFYSELVSKGAVPAADGECRKAAELQAALERRMSILDECGREVRRAVESLCIDHHFEFGPAWLDRLIANPGRDYVYKKEDQTRLKNALIGLSALCIPLVERAKDGVA